jgi:hypothetical protein
MVDDEQGGGAMVADSAASHGGSVAPTQSSQARDTSDFEAQSTLMHRARTAVCDLRQAAQHAEGSENAQFLKRLGVRRGPETRSDPFRTGGSIGAVFDSLCSLAQNVVNDAKLKLYRALLALGAKAEAASDDAGHGPARSLALNRARARYEEGWNLSKEVLLSSGSYAEETVALKQWTMLDIECLSGIERICNILGDELGAQKARSDAMTEVVNPLVHKKLRWQLLYTLTNIRRNSLLNMKTPLRHNWFTLPEAISDNLIQLKREFDARTAAVIFPAVSSPASTFKLPVGWPSSSLQNALAAHQKGAPLKTHAAAASILETLAELPSPLPSVEDAIKSAGDDIDEALWSRVAWAEGSQASIGSPYTGPRFEGMGIGETVCVCDDYMGEKEPPGGYLGFDLSFMKAAEQRELERRLKKSGKKLATSSLLSLSSGARPGGDADDANTPCLPSRLLRISPDIAFASAADIGFQAKVDSELKSTRELLMASQQVFALRSAQHRLDPMIRLRDIIRNAKDGGLPLKMHRIVRDLNRDAASRLQPLPLDVNDAAESAVTTARLLVFISDYITSESALVAHHERRAGSFAVMKDPSHWLSRGRFGAPGISWPLPRLHALVSNLREAEHILLCMQEFGRMAEALLLRESELLDAWRDIYSVQDRGTRRDVAESEEAIEASLPILQETLRSASAELRYKRQVRRLSRSAQSAVEGIRITDSKESESGNESSDDEEADRERVCYACFETPTENDTCVLPCGHILCASDFAHHVLVSRICGKCRSPFTDSQVFRVDPHTMGREVAIVPFETVLLRGIHSVIVPKSPRNLSTGASASAGGTCLGVASSDEVNRVELGSSLSFRYGSKIAALIRRLLVLPADEKAIVVSTWDALLPTIKAACNEAKLGASILTGTPALRADVVRTFSAVAGARVLIMHSETNCAGLTLTAANHLFSLDQLISPSLVMQLIARITRLGQMRPCFIYGLLSTSPIDEVCLKFRQLGLQGLGRSPATASPTDTIELDKRALSLGDLAALLEVAVGTE